MISELDKEILKIYTKTTNKDLKNIFNVSNNYLRNFYLRHRIKKDKSFSNKIKKERFSFPLNTESRHGKKKTTLIKIADKKWVCKQKVLYETYYNTEVKKGNFVEFKNGNREDFRKENLVLLEQKDLFILNVVYRREPKEIRYTKLLLLKIKQHERNNNRLK